MSLIHVKALTKEFSGTKAVNGIDLSIKEGVCTALLGPNGAGKSTTLNMLTGLMKSTSGTINFDNRYVGDRRKFIGYLPQYPKFYGWMSGKEYLLYVGQLGGLTKTRAEEKSEELLKLIGLEDAKKKKISGYSGGMKQRLGIAQALIHEPKLVILDEPVSALDPVGRREVLELMRTLKDETSILFSTHVLHDAEEICDEIYIMKQGKVVIEGELTKLQKDYQRPIISLKTEYALRDWSESLTGNEWVREIKAIKDNEVNITVTDIDIAREKLITDEALKERKLNYFEIGKTRLEDLFMEVTK